MYGTLYARSFHCVFLVISLVYGSFIPLPNARADTGSMTTSSGEPHRSNTHNGAEAYIALIPAAPTALAAEAGLTKDRYVSFNPSTNGSELLAIRIMRVGGIDKYVDCTSLKDLGPDGFYAKLIDGPLPPPTDSSYYCDWSGVTTGLHVTGCSVVPGNNL